MKRVPSFLKPYPSQVFWGRSEFQGERSTGRSPGSTQGQGMRSEVVDLDPNINFSIHLESPPLIYNYYGLVLRVLHDWGVIKNVLQLVILFCFIKFCQLLSGASIFFLCDIELGKTCREMRINIGSNLELMNFWEQQGMMAPSCSKICLLHT